MTELWKRIDTNRIVQDALALVSIPSATGNTVAMAAAYERMLREAGGEVTRYEWISDNPTLVATFRFGDGGTTLLFNGHMDVVTLGHAAPEIKDGRLYARGANDMKGSLACILEVLRVLKATDAFDGTIVVVANSLHESPGGRGEDLIALTEQVPLKADAAIVMEGAVTDCTIAQLGSATFDITIERDGEPSHQLYTPPGTPHPITVLADVIHLLDEWNADLETKFIEDIGYGSYFIGAVQSGEFYNQLTNRATLTGVRRYDPAEPFAEVERFMQEGLAALAASHGVRIELDLRKVRDGYRIAKDSAAVAALQRAAGKVRGIPLPTAGKKLVTDAGILAGALGVPVLCHGPDQKTAHASVEYVEIAELEKSAGVYLQFVLEMAAAAQG